MRRAGRIIGTVIAAAFVVTFLLAFVSVFFSRDEYRWVCEEVKGGSFYSDGKNGGESGCALPGGT